MTLRNILPVFALALGATNALAEPAADPFLWLEEVEGAKALEWVEAHNKISTNKLEAHSAFQEIYEKNLEIYNSKERIPGVSQMGDYLYNFWRDDTHVRGIWRRTSLSEYKKTEPDWETILDLDELARQEDENWVYKGVDCLYPDYRRCFFRLSRGGADATVVREFDIEDKAFVKDGFYLPEAKNYLAWIDEDTVFVGTDFGEGSLTDSGYPKIVKQWQRGTPLDKATTVFEGEDSDVYNYGYTINRDGKKYRIVGQADSFFTSSIFWQKDGGLTPLPIPKDADLISILHGQALVQLKSDWQLGDKTFPQGALIAAPVESLTGKQPNFRILMVPDAKSSIERVHTTQDHVLVNTLNNVSSELLQFSYREGRWQQSAIALPKLGSLSVSGTSDSSNNFFVSYENFLTPDSLYRVSGDGKKIEKLKSLPEFFDGDKFSAKQHFATSKDGTRIPYYQVMSKGMKHDSSNPTLLYGYGGFEVSRTPNYSATTGTAWLEQGGVYVVANIRGGGEFGPAWHQAALKQNRHKAFEDFIAVAEELIARKVTSPEHLGIYGGSNGGLLVGSVFVMRPDLFNAVVCAVPLLDMQRFNKLLAGASWMAEYGDPDKPEDWEYIRGYSPYHNVSKDADYPLVFFKTSTRDDRVHPGHARKMVAKMEAQGHEVLYYENTEGGHAGAANNIQTAYSNALTYTYLLDRLK